MLTTAIPYNGLQLYGTSYYLVLCVRVQTMHCNGLNDVRPFTTAEATFMTVAAELIRDVRCVGFIDINYITRESLSVYANYK